MVITTSAAFRGKQELDDWIKENAPFVRMLGKSEQNRLADQLIDFFPELTLLPPSMSVTRLRSQKLTRAFSVKNVMGGDHVVAGFKFMQGDAGLTRFATYSVIFHLEELPGPTHLTIYCTRLHQISHRQDESVAFDSLEELVHFFCESTFEETACLHLACQKFISGEESPVLILNCPNDWNLLSVAAQFLDVIRSIMTSLRKSQS